MWTDRWKWTNVVPRDIGVEADVKCDDIGEKEGGDIFVQDSNTVGKGKLGCSWGELFEE